MRMSNSPSTHRLLDHRLLTQSNYRNSISPSSSYSEEEENHSEHSGGGNLSSASQAAVNLLGNTNHNSSSSNTNNCSSNNNQFSFNAMNGSNNNNSTDLQQAVAAQQAAAAAAAAAQLVRKLQQHHNNQLNNNSNGNNTAAVAAAAAAAQLSNAANASNAFSNYSAFYNAAAAAMGSGTADLPLLGNINNLANSLAGVKGSGNSSHALSNALNNSNSGNNNSLSNGTGNGPQSPYVATNQYTEITYKGHQVAAFLTANKSPTEYLLCLPQAFELFLKHLVGGLHTVYTKLKRLDIVPIVCNVEQVRILRGRGAIQPGVNRCKLLSTKDFDILYKDCTTARSGRPARPNEDTALLPNCGPDVDLADCDVSCDDRQSRRVLARLSSRLHVPESLIKRHKADLDCNNMLPLLFANEDSGQGCTESSHRSSPNGQLLSPAAAAALRFAVRNSPGISSLHTFNGGNNNLTNSGGNNTSNQNNGNSNQINSNQNNSTNQLNNNSMLNSADFNTTAAYLWLLSQQQQNNSNRNSTNGLLNGDLNLSNSNNNNSNGNSLSNNGLSALNLTRSLTNLASGVNSNNSAKNGHENQLNKTSGTHQLDESTDEDDDDNDHDDEMDESELRSSHSNLSNSTDNHQNSLFNGFKENSRIETPNDQSNNNILGPTLLSNNKENDSTTKDTINKEQLPFGQLGLSNLINNENNELFKSLNKNSDSKIGNTTSQLLLSQNLNSISNNLASADSLETLLRNIENLVSIAVHNARQQEQQLSLHKAELRAELLNVAEKERDFREQLERQLNEEQRIRSLYQKRFKRERRFRKKIEQDLQQVQNLQTKNQQQNLSQNDNSLVSTEKTLNTNGNSVKENSPSKIKTTENNGLDKNGNNSSSSYGSPSFVHDLKENLIEEKDCEMAID